MPIEIVTAKPVERITIRESTDGSILYLQLDGKTRYSASQHNRTSLVGGKPIKTVEWVLTDQTSGRQLNQHRRGLNRQEAMLLMRDLLKKAMARERG